MLERVRNDVGAPLASSARLSDSCVHVHAISHVPYLARGSVLAHSHKRHGTRSAIRKQHSLQYGKTAATRYKLRACNVAIAREAISAVNCILARATHARSLLQARR